MFGKPSQIHCKIKSPNICQNSEKGNKIISYSILIEYFLNQVDSEQVSLKLYGY